MRSWTICLIAIAAGCGSESPTPMADAASTPGPTDAAPSSPDVLVSPSDSVIALEASATVADTASTPDTSFELPADAALSPDAATVADTASAPDTSFELPADAALSPDAASATDEGAPDGSPLPAQREGFWRGQTNQGLPIQLVVDSVGILELEYGWNAGPCASTTRTMFAAAVPIVDDSFHRMIPGGPGGVRTTITGRFMGDAALGGTLDITAIPIPGVPSCSGNVQTSYTATRMSP